MPSRLETIALKTSAKVPKSKEMTRQPGVCVPATVQFFMLDGTFDFESSTMHTPNEFNELLVHVGALLDRESMTLADAGCILAKFIQEQIGCSRVTVWVLDDTGGEGAMRRFAGFDASTNTRITDIAVLTHADCAAYFDALKSERAFISDDCLADDRLAAMRESHLLPNDIRASMDVTIAFNGAARAVICCAQHGAARHWSLHEKAMLKRCAAEVSLRRARRQIRTFAASSVANELMQKMAALQY